MPIVRIKDFGPLVIVYPNDHRPAHVHVIGGGCEAVFNLNCPGGPPELRENYGFTRKALSKIAAKLMSHLATACEDWRKIHGYF